MNEEKKPQSGGLSIGSIQAETVKAAGGDITEDNSQGKIDNTGATIEGGQTNTTHNTQGQEVTFETATQVLFDKLAVNAPEIAEPRAIPDKEPVESPQQDDDSSVESEAPSVEAVVSDDELDAIDLNVEFNDNEDHPKLVMASINKFAAAENPPSAEEQKGLFSRAYSSIKKYATSDDAKAALDFVAGGIEVAAGGLPTPFNLIHYAAKKMSQ